MWKTGPMLILASASPTRNALLRATGLRFVASPAQIDERGLEAAILGKGGGAQEVAVELAVAKALEVARRNPRALVIGADQVLALGDSLLHKPASRHEASEQLARLAGTTHRLINGLALARDEEVVWQTAVSARLTMRASSPGERERVLDLEGDAVLSSVGAYRLEGPSIRLFEQIEGDYFTILGLPVLPLLAALRQVAPDVLEEGA